MNNIIGNWEGRITYNNSQCMLILGIEYKNNKIIVFITIPEKGYFNLPIYNVSHSNNMLKFYLWDKQYLGNLSLTLVKNHLVLNTTKIKSISQNKVILERITLNNVDRDFVDCKYTGSYQEDLYSLRAYQFMANNEEKLQYEYCYNHKEYLKLNEKYRFDSMTKGLNRPA